MHQFFRSTLGQILAITVAASALTFCLVLLLIWFLPPPAPPLWPWQPTYRIASLLESLDTFPAEDRERIASDTRISGIAVSFLKNAVACKDTTKATRDLESVLRAELSQTSHKITARFCAGRPASERIQVLASLGAGSIGIWLDDPEYQPPYLTAPLIVALLFASIAVASMSAWAVWRVIRPLRRLSDLADAFGADGSIIPIKEEGPIEIRRVASAFNRMQGRIAKSIHDRTRMLAAISHDLRTPLTRMRLYVDTAQAPEARPKLLQNIDLMQRMIESALTFLKGGPDTEGLDWLDFGALIETVVDEYNDTGANVHYEPIGRIRFYCRPSAMRRVLTNLVDNALQHGEAVEVRAYVQEAQIVLEICDDGPGIPSDQFDDVLEPFVRLDRSRATRSGNFGLGLSIVKEIVNSHNGKLQLSINVPSGLIVRLMFPEQKQQN